MWKLGANELALRSCLCTCTINSGIRTYTFWNIYQVPLPVGGYCHRYFKFQVYFWSWGSLRKCKTELLKTILYLRFQSLTLVVGFRGGSRTVDCALLLRGFLICGIGGDGLCQPGKYICSLDLRKSWLGSVLATRLFSTVWILKNGGKSCDTVTCTLPHALFPIASVLTCVSLTLTGDFEGTGGLCRSGIFGSCSETVRQGELFTYHCCLIKRLDKLRHNVPCERNYLGIHFRCCRRSGSARSPPVMKRPWRLSGQVLWWMGGEQDGGVNQLQ